MAFLRRYFYLVPVVAALVSMLFGSEAMALIEWSQIGDEADLAETEMLDVAQNIVDTGVPLLIAYAIVKGIGRFISSVF